MKNEKGFTLIEILAVIIIMAILLLIAVPSVSRYIEESRQKSYVTTVKNTLKSAGSMISSIDKKLINKETTYYIPIQCIKVENGTPKSPYDEFDNAYIVAGWESNNYGIYFYGRDKSGVGVKKLIKVNDFEIENIEKDIKKESITLDKKIADTTEIMLLDVNDCKTISNIDN